jgi:hypothetical protein
MPARLLLKGKRMTYERTVAAALTETKSKFALAEALATDIPPRTRGPKVGPELTVTEHLALARVDIRRAGGEPRSVKTLNDYRMTALWVSTELGRNFAWIAGASFSAHDEARAAGLSYDEFAAMKVKTVDAIRGRAGLAGTDGQAEQIAKSWTPEQKASAVRELLADDEVAEQVTEAVEDFVASDSTRTAHVISKRRASMPSPEPQPFEGDVEVLRPERDYDAMTEQWVNLLAVTEAAKSSGKWAPTERSEALRYFAAQILDNPSKPTGEQADLVNEKLENLFAEAEAYANSESAS